MDPEQWRRIEALVDAAAAREGRERAAFLDEACGGDVELRREVESLLAEQSGAEGFLASGAWRPPALAPGTKLGPHEILGLVGSGGMGEVYKARDTRLDRIVAIKTLPVDLAADLTRRRRFEQEARAIAGLSHVHICAIYDIGFANGINYLVLEYLKGETLASVLRRGPLSMERALRTGIQLCDALWHAHRAGIVHGDLKPSNVMLTPGGAKLLDFGLATQRQGLPEASTKPRTDDRLTGGGRLFGTLPYMAPEHFSGQAPDAHADVFALGAVLFEMLTGRKPFDAPTDADLIAALLNRDAPSLFQFRPTAPPSLERLVRRCLAKRPGERWHTAGDLASELRWIMDSIRTWVGRSAVGPSSSGGRLPRGPRDIAVLPFCNITQSSEDDYFVDGMTDSLISSLATIRSLRVIARSSVMRYKGAVESAREIAHELGVDCLIEGSVWRTGNRIRVSARLVAPATGILLWAETYDCCDVGEVLVLVPQIAQAVTEAIDAAVSPAERARMLGRTVSQDAHDAYLRGQFLIAKGTPGAIHEACAWFRKAIGHDPGYALAHVGLARYFIGAVAWRLLVPNDALREAMVEAQAALSLDSELAMGHAVLGHASTFTWDMDTADRALRQAICLDPSDPAARAYYARFLTFVGSHEAAIEQAALAEELDPLSGLASFIAAVTFYSARAFERAVVKAGQAIELASAPNSFYVRALALAMLGNFDAALADMTVAVRRSRRHPSALAGLAYVKACAGRHREARAMLTRLTRDMGRTSVTRHITPVDLAEVCAGLGDTEQALRHLERAFDERTPELCGAYADPIFEPLRDDSRFLTLARRLGVAC